MDIQKAIQQGKTQFFWLSAGMIGLSLVLLMYEMANWESTGLLVAQCIAAVLVVSLSLMTNAGFKFRWGLFMVLILVGLLAFYMGGSRMGNFEKGEVNMISYLSVLAGLAYIGGGIFLSFSGEIGVYLRSKVATRKGEGPKNP